jgi:nitrogen fixation protein FixH
MKKGWYWPWLIVALLFFTAGFQGWLIFAATHDPSMAIEPDYYRKAVAWDERMAQDSVSESLHWQPALSLGAIGRDGARVTVRLGDSAGAPVRGARVRVVAIHNLDGTRHIEGALESQGDGSYAAQLPLDRTGLWEVRVEALRGREHFTASLRADATSAPASSR